MNTKYKILYSLLISGLMSYEPLFLLHKHFYFAEIIDKTILILASFLICWVNFYWAEKEYIYTKSITKTVFSLGVKNITLFLGISTIKVFFWQIIQPFHHPHHHRPPFTIFLAMDFMRQVLMSIGVSLIYTLVNKTKKEFEYLNRLQALENQSLQLQIQGLTAQLHPHFFFNSLNTLSELVQSDKVKSEQFIQQLTQFFRYVLTNQQNNFISLNEELKFIKTYLYLMEIRFENRFSVEYSLESIDKYQIPSIVCLFVLENIFKHNVVEKLKIYFSIDHTSQCFIIKNSIRPKIDFSVDKLGYGLENARQKCFLLTQRDIKTVQTETHFEVRLPLILAQ